MPRGKRAARVERPNGPDFEGAAKLLRSLIGSLRDDNRSVQADLSAAWKRVETETGVNRQAAKAIMGLLNKSEETQADFLRTFDGLRAQFNLGPATDLVDLAEQGEEGEGEDSGEPGEEGGEG